MKTFTKLLAVLAVVGLVGLAQAADKPKGDKPVVKAVRGKITKIDGAKLEVTGRDGKAVTVETDASTKVMIDKEAKTVADLKEGMFVQVTPETGKAEKINAMTKLPEKPKK